MATTITTKTMVHGDDATDTDSDDDNGINGDICDRCIGHDATCDDDNDGHDDLDVVYEDGCDLNAVRDADHDGDNHGEHDHGDHRRRDHHSVRHSA